MKSRTIILLAVAIICGLGAAYMTTFLIGKQPKQEETINVLVAKETIPQGMVLKEPEKHFTVQAYRKESVPPGAKLENQLGELKDKQVRRGMPAGMAVTEWHLGKGTGLGATIEKGYRAISVSANVNKDGGGFILPNSKVDVICTVNEGDKSRAATILQNVLVLGINQQEETPENQSVLIPTTVTLKLKPEEAELLALATTKGQIQLVLRNHDDSTPVNSQGVATIWQSKFGGGEPTATVTQKAETEKVLIAKDAIEIGTIFTDPAQYFETIEFTKGTAPAGSVRSIQDLKDKKVCRNIVARQYVLNSDLVGADDPINPAAAAAKAPEAPAYWQEFVNGTRTERVYRNKAGEVMIPEKQ